MLETLSAYIKEERTNLHTCGKQKMLERVKGIEQQRYEAWYQKAEAEWASANKAGQTAEGPAFDIVYVGSAAQRKKKLYEKQWKRQPYTKWKLCCEITWESALANCQGDFVLQMEDGDCMPDEALMRMAAALAEKSDVDFLYVDEDELTCLGKKQALPHFKPDFNEALLCSTNYIRYGFCVRRDLWEVCMKQLLAAGMASTAGWRYDFVLRCTEIAKTIHHIPQILYHHQRKNVAKEWRLAAKAWDQGVQSLNGHYERTGRPAQAEKHAWVGTWKTTFSWTEQPLVSIIIPSKDHAEDLNRCIDSIREKERDLNYEILIVENNSTDAETFANYRRLETLDSRIRVMNWSGEFNYSKINNDAVKEAKGEYLLFLNNDTEMIRPGSIREMLDQCQVPEVGIVGAKLIYGDTGIQHAGVVIGYSGIAGHTFITMPGAYIGYERRAVLTQDYSAVTAACMMTRRETFERAGRFSEDFKVAFNDIDYCLKVCENGERVVYAAEAQWFHYESKSRGYEDTDEKQKRFQGECERFQKRWRQMLDDGDPAYNPNLALNRADFARREL